MRDVRNEVATDLLEPVQMTDVACQQQMLVASEWQHAHIELAVRLPRRGDVVERLLCAIAQPVGQIGNRQSLLQQYATITWPAQPEQVFGCVIEPAHLLVLIEQHDRIRQLAGGVAQIAQTGGNSAGTCHEAVMLKGADGGGCRHHGLGLMTD